MVGNLLFRLDAEESMQRGVAADFGEAGVIGGMPQERGQHGDAQSSATGKSSRPRPRARRSPSSRELSGMASRQRRIVPREGESSRAAHANRGWVSAILIAVSGSLDVD